MEKNGKKEELIIPSDNCTQALLSKFINGQLQTLEPDYDQQTGYHYAIVEGILGDDSKVIPFLNKLCD